MADKKKPTRRKLPLPDAPPAPDLPLPRPFDTAPGPGGATRRRRSPTGRLRGMNKAFYHYDQPPYRFASKPSGSGIRFRGGVDPDFLSRFTTGPISNEQDVVRQFEAYEALTADPLMELYRRRKGKWPWTLQDEFEQAEQDHVERLRQPYPLTADTRRRRK